MAPYPKTDKEIKEINVDHKGATYNLGALINSGETGLFQAYKIIEELTDTSEGIHRLYDKAAQLDKAGIFNFLVWEDPKKLVPIMVSGTLMADSPTSTLEIVSNLRMLAYATGKAHSRRVSREQSLDYLEQVITHNLNYAFEYPGDEDINRLRAFNMVQLMLEKIPFESLKKKLAEEVERITAQRPILTKRVKNLLKLVNEKIELHPKKSKADETLDYYIKVIKKPTKNSTTNEEYLEFLNNAEEKELKKEAKQFGEHLSRTGLSSSFHAIFVEFAAEVNPELLVDALDMCDTCEAEFREHQKLIKHLIKAAISPYIPQSVYGLSKVIENGVLSHRSIRNALTKLMAMEIHPDLEEKIQQSDLSENGISANELLVAGVLNVLGQPLGIGQGDNPTCQSVRAISLWSDQAPVKLLDMIITAARFNDLEFHFEGDVLRSSSLPPGLAEEFYLNLDPVSIVLVPHLDKIYNEMMRRTQLRGQDGHKWVNPAFYGYWIPTAFMSAFNPYSQVTDYEKFIRTFYATQHPYYNGGYKIVFPNPLGIIITSSYGKFSGFHAISLLRVSKGPGNQWRAYFLNPQNEGRQDWGQNIKPTVQGNCEKPGESSLPFDEFLSRVYAFHYNSMELGDISKIDQRKIDKITKLAKESWGERYSWI